jgi:hypothetical protein
MSGGERGGSATDTIDAAGSGKVVLDKERGD